LDPLAVLKRDVAGLKVIETNGVVDVDAVLGGGDGMGEVVVSQLRTLEDLSYLSMKQIAKYRLTWIDRHFVVLAVIVKVQGICISSVVEDVTHPIVGRNVNFSWIVVGWDIHLKSSEAKNKQILRSDDAKDCKRKTDISNMVDEMKTMVRMS